MQRQVDCRNVKSNFEELLLAPGQAPAEARAHVACCAECGRELAELRATMAALDLWEAPEPSPYFDSRMAALLRAEQQAEPAGFLERMRARLLFGNGVQLRPLAAGALALLLLIGGGTYAGFVAYDTPPAPQPSAAVRDLQSLDENAQVFQQLTSLDQEQQQDQQGDQDSGPVSSNL